MGIFAVAAWSIRQGWAAAPRMVLAAVALGLLVEAETTSDLGPFQN